MPASPGFYPTKVGSHVQNAFIYTRILYDLTWGIPNVAFRCSSCHQPLQLVQLVQFRTSAALNALDAHPPPPPLLGFILTYFQFCFSVASCLIVRFPLLVMNYEFQFFSRPNMIKAFLPLRFWILRWKMTEKTLLIQPVSLWAIYLRVCLMMCCRDVSYKSKLKAQGLWIWSLHRSQWKPCQWRRQREATALKSTARQKTQGPVSRFSNSLSRRYYTMWWEVLLRKAMSHSIHDRAILNEKDPMKFFNFLIGPYVCLERSITSKFITVCEEELLHVRSEWFSHF